MKLPGYFLCDSAQRQNVWKDSGYFDLWSVIHLISGMTFGLVFRMMKFRFKTAAFVTLLLLIFWEIFENLFLLRESWSNIILDVIIGFSGFTVSYYGSRDMKKSCTRAVMAAFLIIVAILSIAGWIAYYE